MVQSTFSSSSLTMLPERERETPRHCTATGRAGLRPTAAAVSSQVCRFRLPRFFCFFFFFLTLGNFPSSRRFLCVLGGISLFFKKLNCYFCFSFSPPGGAFLRLFDRRCCTQHYPALPSVSFMPAPPTPVPYVPLLEQLPFFFVLPSLSFSSPFLISCTLETCVGGMPIL